jgi:hypothetical protein
MMDDNAARFTHADLEKMVFALSDRLLIVEDKLGLPMSYVEKILVGAIARRKEEARLADARRNEAFLEAKLEAEKVGHRGPLDEFVHRMNAGEFETPARPNGG